MLYVQQHPFRFFQIYRCTIAHFAGKLPFALRPGDVEQLGFFAQRAKILLSSRFAKVNIPSDIENLRVQFVLLCRESRPFFLGQSPKQKHHRLSGS